MKTTPYFDTVVRHKHPEVRREWIEMKLQYFPDTDTLYIDLLDKCATVSDEIANDVVVDYDADGAVVGIGIDLASAKVDLTKIEVSDLPNVHVLSATRPTRETASVEA